MYYYGHYIILFSSVVTICDSQSVRTHFRDKSVKVTVVLEGSVLKTFKQLELYHLKLQAGSGTFQTFKTLLALCNYESCDFIPTLLSE